MNKPRTASRIAITVTLGVSVLLFSACTERIAPRTSPTCVRTLSADDVVRTEGTPGASRLGYTEFTFTISSTGCAAPGTIQYSVEPVGAYETVEGDFTGALQGPVTFESGDNMRPRTIVIRIVDDDDGEPTETFAVCIRPAILDGTIEPALFEGIGIIVDNDGLPLPTGVSLLPKPDELHCSQ